MLPILNQSFWRDEAFSVLLAQRSIHDIIVLSSRDVSPGILHYFFLHYWMMVFGTSEVATRGLSFLFHILTALIVFLLVQRLTRSSLVQTLISTATLLNPFLLQYAFEARAYSLLAFLTILVVYGLVAKRYTLASIALALGILTHDFGILTYIAVLAWWLVTYQNMLRKTQRVFLDIFAAPTVVLLILLSIIYGQWVKVGQGFWITQATSTIFLHSLEVYSRGDIGFAMQPMLYFVTLILCFFAFAFWIALYPDTKQEEPDPRRSRPFLLLFFAAFLPTVITYIVSALFVPVYHERYLIGAVPLIIILIGVSLNKLTLSRPHLRNALIGLTAIYMIVLVQSSEQEVAASTKPAVNYAVRQVLAKAQDGDVIVPEQAYDFLTVKYYLEQNGKQMPIYAYSKDGRIPFYIGAVLFTPQDIIRQFPKGRVWQIKSDGGYQLLHQ